MASKSKKTSTNTLDPQYGALVYGNADRANNLANSFQPYTGQLTAGFNDAQKEAQQGILDFSSQKVGSGLLGQAQNAATQGAAYNPMQVGAQQVQAGQLSNTDLSPYMNPFQSQVIDSTLGQYDRQNQIDLNNARGRAAAGGAFGGSGSALLQAQTQEANGRTLASTLAGLNSQNFSQAQGAAQSDIASRLAAAQGNQGASLSADQGNQAAGLQGNAQRLQSAGILSGLSDQQRAQGLQDWQLESAVGDTQQAQQQAQLDSQHQAYLDWINTQMQGQQVANSGVGLVPQLVNNTTTTTQSPGLAGIAGALGSIGMAAATGGASLGMGGGLSGILGGLSKAKGVLGGDVSQYAGSQ